VKASCQLLAPLELAPLAGQAGPHLYRKWTTLVPRRDGTALGYGRPDSGLLLATRPLDRR